MFDLFGMGKSASGAQDEAAADLPEDSNRSPVSDLPGEKAVPASPGRSKKFWGALLVLDAIILLSCLGFVGVRLLEHFASKPAVVKTARKPKTAMKPVKPDTEKKEKPKTAPPEQVKSAPKETAAPIKEKPTTDPKVKGPAGSPAVHAKDLPSRSAQPKGAKKPEATKKQAAVSTEKKRTTKPISFDYADPEAEKVSLVGMFLVRSGGSKPMFKNSMGIWEITVYLNTGFKYRYQFEVIDKKGRKKLTPVKTIEVL